MIVWRIVRRAHASLDGEGARLYGSRWTSRGQPAVFASATLSLAALERFVHTDPDLEPAGLVAVEIEIESRTRVDVVAIADLPPRWRGYPAPVELTATGDHWLKEGRTLVLLVPSAVIPRERNVIINPGHADVSTLTVLSREPFAFDPRTWKAR